MEVDEDEASPELKAAVAYDYRMSRIALAYLKGWLLLDAVFGHRAHFVRGDELEAALVRAREEGSATRVPRHRRLREIIVFIIIVFGNGQDRDSRASARTRHDKHTYWWLE